MYLGAKRRYINTLPFLSFFNSGRQPNFVALNRGRHIYSARRPSRWALAHILVVYYVAISVNAPPKSSSS